MLDDGERLVPGFRQARALRVWAGVRPLFQDAKAVRHRHARRHAARTRCSTTAQRDGVDALPDDHRRQAHDATG